MADYRLSAQVISRADGRSAVAAAAYRAGVDLTDERTGTVHDFRRKGGVEDAWISAPEAAPEWASDRAQLWNNVEASERRKDAQVARELQLSLPHELTFEQRKALVADFVNTELVARGMVVDIAMHSPSRGGDDRNFHAHLMLTTREIGPDGFGKKERDWNKTEVLEQWRQAWAETQNRHLRQHLGERAPQVTHLSLRDQGKEQIATHHLGPAATEMERRGVSTARGDLNRSARDRNQAVAEWRRRQGEVAAAITPAKARQLAAIEAEMRVRGKDLSQRVLEARNDLSRIIEQRKELKIASKTAIENEILGGARAAFRQAERALSAVEDRAAAPPRARMSLRQIAKGRAFKAPGHSIAQWIRNPQRVIFQKIRQALALARANREFHRRRIELMVRQAWLASPDGRAYVASRAAPASEKLRELRAAERAARRHVRQAERAAQQAKYIEQKAATLRAAGLREVAAPERALQERRYFNDVGRAVETQVRALTPAQRRAAEQALAQSLQRGR